MFKLNDERQTVTISNLRGGIGDLARQDLFTPAEAHEKINLCAVLTIPDGCSIGEHAHGPDAEFYYVLSGSLRVTDNGVTKDLTAGDAVFTGGGTSHGVVNASGKDATLLAVIVK
jgi:quercetin dioxygenase-like cupin family protein